MTASMTEIEQITLDDVSPYEDNDDPNHRTHIINPPSNTHIWQPGMTTQEIVDIARATDQEIRALCGKIWVPKGNPENYDTCERCIEIANQIISEEG